MRSLAPSAGQLARKPPYLLPQDPAPKARKLMTSLRLRALPIVADERSERLQGVVERRSLLLLSSTRAPVAVSELAEEPPLLLAPETPLRSAAEAITKLGLRDYAVIADEAGRYLGLLGAEDILEYLVKETMIPEGLRVADAMREPPPSVSPSDPVYRVWQLMLREEVSRVPVLDEKGRLVGVVSEHDLLARGYARPELETGNPRRGPRVAEVMSTPAASLPPEAPLAEAARIMASRGIGSIYVYGDKLLGVVERLDVVKAWLERHRRA